MLLLTDDTWYRIIDDICGTIFFSVLVIMGGLVVKEWLK
jgi:hypothetical protein